MATLDAMATLLRRQESLFLAPQNLVEFWAVATRPVERNGLGLSVLAAEVELARLEGQFPLLSESPAVYAHWRRLVTTHGVLGIRAHDARLAAMMLVHGVTHLLTYNVGDFRRYAHITIVDPQDISQSAP
jgi:predicted nucleic acid-binding protein